MKNKLIKTPKCTNCYDKGYHTVMSGGNTVHGDFIGDPSYFIKPEIHKIPCKKCSPSVTIVSQSVENTCFHTRRHYIDSKGKGWACDECGVTGIGCAYCSCDVPPNKCGHCSAYCKPSFPDNTLEQNILIEYVIAVKPTVLALGKDSKIYYWSTDTAQWKIFDNNYFKLNSIEKL